MAIPAFLICSEEPRTCQTTAKRDWYAGLLGKMLLLHRAAQRKFQKIFRTLVIFGLRFHLSKKKNRTKRSKQIIHYLHMCTLSKLQYIIRKNVEMRKKVHK